MAQIQQLVYCYAEEDEGHRVQLERHLTALKQDQFISDWHAGAILAGEDQHREITQRLSHANVALLLISADFLASVPCQVMLAQALQHHDERRLQLIAIIVRPCLWESAALGGLTALPKGGTAVTAWGNQDQGWRAVATGLKEILQTSTASAASPAPAPINPYRGLEVFGPEHQALFFGREALTRRLWRTFRRLHHPVGAQRPSRMLTILGPSGSGKSSLARAGLCPLLCREPVIGVHPPQVVLVEPGARPIENLARMLLPLTVQGRERLEVDRLHELEASLKEPSSSGTYEGLRRFAVTLPTAAPLLLLVDQFEKVLTSPQAPRVALPAPAPGAPPRSDAEIFICLLLHAASDAESPVSVLLTLRSDFLAETRKYPELNRAISEEGAQALVPVMTPDELRRSIELPARSQGRSLEAILPALLVGALDREGALPLLEFALQRIWSGLSRGLTPESALQESGGVGGALAAAAQLTYDQLTPEEQGIARRALLRLGQREGARMLRRSVALGELVARKEDPQRVRAVLRRFAQPEARLLTLSGTEGGQEFAEVTHEVLFEHWVLLRDWINQRRDDLPLQRHLREAAQRWERAGRPAGSLARSPELEQLRSFVARAADDLNALEDEFLETSLEQQRAEEAAARELRRLRAEEQRHLVEARLAAEALAEAERKRRLTIEALGMVAVLLVVIVARWLWSEHEGAVRIAQFDIEQGQQELARGDSQRALLYLSRAYHQRNDAEVRYPLAAALASLERVTTIDLGGAVTSMAFSADGARIITTGADGTTRWWDSATGAVLERPPDAGAEPPRPEAPLSATTTATGVLLSDRRTNAALATLAEPKAKAVVIAPDATRVVTLSETDEGQDVRLWDIATYRTRPCGEPLSQHLARLEDPASRSTWSSETRPAQSKVTAVSFSQDSTQLVTTSTDGTARLWSARTGKTLATLVGYGGPLTSAAFSPDGRRIVLASQDGTARLWLPQRLLTTLVGHKAAVRAASFNRDGTALITASPNGARLWDGRSGVLTGHLRVADESVSLASFSPDGAHVVTASGEAARLWSSTTGAKLYDLLGHTKRINTAVFSRDGSRLLTAGEDHTARLWDGQTGRHLTTLQHNGDVTAAAFSPDPQGARILSSARSGELRLWDGKTGALLLTLENPINADHAWFSPDGSRIVGSPTLLSSTVILTFRLWDQRLGTLRPAPQDSSGVYVPIFPIGFLCWDASPCLVSDSGDRLFSRDGSRLLIASEDPKDKDKMIARLWSASTGEALASLDLHTRATVSAVFSPDGARLVTASDDHTARLWDGRSGRPLATLVGHSDSLFFSAFSPDGALIVTTSADHTARLWDGRSGRPLAVLEGHSDTVNSAAFSADGARLITVSNDETARLWDVQQESRAPEIIDQLVRCYVPYRLYDDRLVPSQPDRRPCRSLATPSRSSRHGR